MSPEIKSRAVSNGLNIVRKWYGYYTKNCLETYFDSPMNSQYNDSYKGEKEGACICFKYRLKMTRNTWEYSIN